MKRTSYQDRTSRLGFALLELLVVLGIIVTLIAFLLPAAAGARHSALRIECMENIHRLCMGLSDYAQTNKGMFPPNQTLLAPPRYWCDFDRVGRILPTTIDMGGGLAGGSGYGCPEDDGGARSYSMNVWASSAVDSYVTTAPPHGHAWRSSNLRGSRLILVAESWSWWTVGPGSWFAPPSIGYMGLTAGQKFGALGGIAPPFYAGRWGYLTCELAFNRHHFGSTGTGATIIGFGDGSVRIMSRSELVNSSTGQITGAALWSPDDHP
jgi:type II secretory pathway pseudopilin PulG